MMTTVLHRPDSRCKDHQQLETRRLKLRCLTSTVLRLVARHSHTNDLSIRMVGLADQLLRRQTLQCNAWGLDLRR